MKKTVSIILLIAAAALMLCACGAKSGGSHACAGNWECLEIPSDMKAKTVLGFAVGTTSYKLDLSPDISWPDPTVNFSSQITQIGLKILDEYNFFDIFNKQHAIQNRKQDTMDIQEKPQ